MQQKNKAIREKIATERTEYLRRRDAGAVPIRPEQVVLWDDGQGFVNDTRLSFDEQRVLWTMPGFVRA